MFYLCVKFEICCCTHSKFTKGGPKFTNLAPGPYHAPFRYNLSSLRWDMSWSICVPNLKFLAAPVPNILNGPIIYKFGPCPFGVFVIPEMIYLCTKLEVSTWTRSKFKKGVPKFTNLAPGPRPIHAIV